VKKVFDVIIPLLFVLTLSLAVAGCSGSGELAPIGQTTQQVVGLVYADPTVVTNTDGTQYVKVDLLTQGNKMTVSTKATTSEKVTALKATLVKGNLVDYLIDSAVDIAVAIIPNDAAKTFNKILAKGSSAAAQFDTMKYGLELSPYKGVAGNMVAAGWIYAKTASTITVGDGRVLTDDISGRALPKPVKRYEETYNVASDVKVYNVNTTDYSTSAISDYSSIPVTADYSYRTTSRQAAYFVFDKNYKEADSAKVVAIYYFTPKSTSDGKPVWDVPTQSYLLKDKGVDPASGKNYVDIVASGVSSDPYTRSTEPFEIVKNTFYYIGDNEVAVYLFNCDMGTPNDKSDDRLIVLDAGWPNSGYQYWKNIEAMGYDPRKVTDWMSTHGHGDHYGTAVELFTMVENAGGKIKVWGTQEDTFGLTKDAQGNAWNIAGALPASETVIRSKTVPYEYDKWYDFGNVQILVTPTPGHTAGTGSFVFKTKNPLTNSWISFGYMGGYGYNGLYTPTANNGWLRLNFQLGLAWLQQNVAVDYVSPQHTNQYPFVETYQALKAYNNDPANANNPLTMLDALTSKMPDSPGLVTTEFVNFCEKRYSVITNAASDLNDSRYSSLETTGPFKPGRENGLTVRATLKDGGKIIQGFDGFQNKNPRLPLLKDGIQIITDAYVNDSSGWYVQFYIDVLDDATYKGYLPTGHSQAALTYNGINSSGAIVTKSLAAITYVGGPVESLHVGTGTPEVLRTQRLSSKADAEKILASVTIGGTYTINLTKASAIIVPADVTKTFTP
jgi:glyoxylase-like metal-dependent hydrolase (beta-lactamase superfamily II)